MQNERKILGAKGEHVATQFLQDNGYIILNRNWRCQYGEIDIIATHKEYLVFIEVKSRKQAINPISPLLNITTKKQNTLKNLGVLFLQQEEKLTQLQPRFDVVTVIFDKANTIVKHYINAF